MGFVPGGVAPGVAAGTPPLGGIVSPPVGAGFFLAGGVALVAAGAGVERLDTIGSRVM